MDERHPSVGLWKAELLLPFLDVLMEMRGFPKRRRAIAGLALEAKRLKDEAGCPRDGVAAIVVASTQACAWRETYPELAGLLSRSDDVIAAAEDSRSGAMRVGDQGSIWVCPCASGDHSH